MSPRNILLVSIDSLRFDVFKDVFWGHNRTINTLLEDGLIFTNAVAPGPYTEISIPSTVGGEFLFHSSRDSNLEIRNQIYTHGSIASQLSQKGYETIGFSPNPHASRYYGIEHGFDHFEDFLKSPNQWTAVKLFLERLMSGDLVEGIRIAANISGFSIPGFGNQSIPLRAYESQAVSRIKNVNEPWFLWLFMLEPHSPFRPIKEYREISLLRMLWLNLLWSHLLDRKLSDRELDQVRKLYEDSVRMTSDAIGQFYSELTDQNPVLILHGDHGEAFGEHGSFGHGKSLYDENIHVPLAILNIPTSGKIEKPISLKEIPAMVAEIAETGEVDPTRHTNKVAIARVPNHSLSVRDRAEKYIFQDCILRYCINTDPTENNPMKVDSKWISDDLVTYLYHQRERRLIGEIMFEFIAQSKSNL